jgi:hypothetical protein
MDDHTSKPPTQGSLDALGQSREGSEVDQRVALECEKLRLERQKYALEIRLKRREFQEKKEKNAWKEALANPVTIAVVGGTLTLVTAIVTNYFNSSEARRGDAARALLAEENAKEALEADLIKKFVESPRTDSVRENLRFLVDAGLIPTYAESIKKYLDTNPGVAPQVGGGVEFSPSGVSVSDEVKETTQKAATRFAMYLQNLGFPGLEQNVSVFIFSKDRSPPNMPVTNVNAFYVNKTIFIHEALATDVSVALREYAHHALFISLGSPVKYHQNEIESALSDYLPASFLGSPIIGNGLGALFGLTTSYIRTLDSDAPYEGSSVTPMERGAAWSAALWACRGRVGQQAVDGMILPAWRQAMSAPVDDGHVAKEFRKALTSAAPPVGSCFSAELGTRMIP